MPPLRQVPPQADETGAGSGSVTQMQTLIIASTRPGAGKTAIAAMLAALLGRGQRRALIAKGWSADPANDADAAALRSLLPDAVSLAPEQAQGPAAAAGRANSLAGRLKLAGGGAAVVIVEGACGDAAPNMALAEELDGRVVLVCGMDDDVEGAAGSYGGRLLGVVINGVPRYQTHRLESDIVPALARASVTFLGGVPEDRRLIAPALDLVADHLGAEFALLPELGKRLIDNFLIGGLVLDWGPTYFGSQENTGVIVRGDRPDVQLAALHAGGTRALVLTKGISPVEYVYYEAQERGIPVLVSPFDTHETTARLETLLPRVRFDHPEKLARMIELTSSYLDLGAVEQALAQPATG